MDALAARLPGLQPVADGDWLRVDDAYAAQMAYRDQLLNDRTSDVFMRHGSPDAAETLLLEKVEAAVLALPGFARVAGGIRRPDGVVIDPALEASPMIAAARLAQEDFLILDPTETGHVLVSAVLCFPASWSLHQKIGRNMAGSAAAMGFRQVLALKGTAALWSPKVLRAGMGAHFGLRLIEGLGPEDLSGLSVPLVATSSYADAQLHQVQLPRPCAWVMGHEGQGVQPGLMARCLLTVGIPQPGGEESLNVGSAAAICLYESARQRLLAPK